ncbi:unnamed protein product [Haemonchus placei]|uniref:Secreted protein n=1 Tax=Haemonchus placei TaxID=6290 RepID=A0A0N4WI04_HAEPC|nr:unnamed protein product [Haemonchus placei]
MRHLIVSQTIIHQLVRYIFIAPGACRKYLYCPFRFFRGDRDCISCRQIPYISVISNRRVKKIVHH